MRSGSGRQASAASERREQTHLKMEWRINNSVSFRAMDDALLSVFPHFRRRGKITTTATVFVSDLHEISSQSDVHFHCIFILIHSPLVISLDIHFVFRTFTIASHNRREYMRMYNAFAYVFIRCNAQKSHQRRCVDESCVLCRHSLCRY